MLPSKDDRTILPGSTADPAARGQPQSASAALPIGTFLRHFEITRLIGEGGFGIVYLARDHRLERHVAIKEYMPATLARRVEGPTIAPVSEQHRSTFEAGLSSFRNEARLLAHFDHPSLIKVYDYWDANATAYMVTPFYEGTTLTQHLKNLGGPPGEAWLKHLLRLVIGALEVIHDENCMHRDVSPDNILIRPNGVPVLLDFGAARTVIADMTQALTVILKPGYAPIEQYGEGSSGEQGPWSDVYALAAVVYFAITGKAPTASVSRIVSDKLPRLTDIAAGGYSNAFLAAIDKALSVRREERPQNVRELAAALGLDEPRATPEWSTLSPAAPHEAQQEDQATRRRTQPAASPVAPAHARHARAPLWLAGGLGLAAVAAVWVVLAYQKHTNDTPPAKDTTVREQTAPAPPTPAAEPAPKVEARIAPAPAPSAAPRKAPEEVSPPPVQRAERAVPPPAPSALPRKAPEAVSPPPLQRAERAVPPPAAPEKSAQPPEDVVKPEPRRAATPPPARTQVSKSERASEPRSAPRSTARCSDLLSRLQLGEPISSEEQAILQKECRR